MSSELDEVTELHVARAVDALVDEFGELHPRAEIERLVRDSVQRLAPAAEVNDFVPTLAHRFARERLLASDHQLGDGPVGILFVGLGDSGRAQMAAALTSLRSERRIVARSAGSAAVGALDSNVVEVMAELDVDLTEAYAKPVTDEVLRAADIVVTMGRSVGAIEVPDESRRLDWRVGDPTGAELDEVRNVRDDIDRRVQALVRALNAETAEE